MWDKHCYIGDKLHSTSLTLQVVGCPVASEFYICNVEKCKSTSKFQMLTAYLFVVENIKSRQWRIQRGLVGGFSRGFARTPL